MHSLAYQYQVQRVDSPIWAFAIHDGHHLDVQLQPFMRLTSANRLYEEDPFTALIGEVDQNTFFCGTSRFQLDINRPAESCVYLLPEQAWGLEVWQPSLPPLILEQLYAAYAAIYSRIQQLIEDTIARYGFFLLLDIHSYNIRGATSAGLSFDPAHPQINIGTAPNYALWNPLIAYFVEQWRTLETLHGGSYDVRENINFRGGYLAQYLCAQYGDYGCVLSLEFRKDFMDEYSGIPSPHHIMHLRQCLLSLVCRLKKQL